MSVEKSFNRARISEKDFEEAGAYLEALKNDHSDVIRRSLLIAAIIVYSRPFSNNKNHDKATNAIVGKPKRILSEKGYELHERIIGYRNKAIAHSDFEKNPTSTSERMENGFVGWSRKFDVLGEPIDIDLFIEIQKSMRSHAVNKIFELNRELNR